MSEPHVCICDWLKSLNDDDVMSAMGCMTKEYERRWPGSAHQMTPEELADPEKIALSVAKTQAAMPESVRGKNQ